MKKWKMLIAFLFIAGTFYNAKAQQKPVPWSNDEILHPADLAAKIKNNQPHPVIFDVGPSGVIKGAIKTGPAHEAAGLQALQTQLQKLKSYQTVIIYCGCCPYDHCPNIRPAYKAVKDMGFSHVLVLDLPHNLKQDWIDKGYPMQ